MVSLADSSIVICSIVRNADSGLRRNIPVIKALCRRFKDYKVFVYENDSTDKTKEYLNDWAISDSGHVFVSLNTNDSSETIPSQKGLGKVCQFFSLRRIEKMAHLRNHYMEYIDNQGWNADYLIVVDLDVARLSLEGILSSFLINCEWDAVTAFGYSTAPNLRKRYHDTYALIEYGDEEQPQTMKKIRSLAGKFGRLKGTRGLIRVSSAFGGLAIYRFGAVKGLKYFALPNDDERVEVRCEHYSIYKQMAERGYEKVFINPQMELKYQNLTWKIILNSIKRKLKI